MGSLHFHVNFRYSLRLSAKKYNRDLYSDYIESIDQFVEKLPSKQYWEYQPANIDCISIYWILFISLNNIFCVLCTILWTQKKWELKIKVRGGLPYNAKLEYFAEFRMQLLSSTLLWMKWSIINHHCFWQPFGSVLFFSALQYTSSQPPLVGKPLVFMDSLALMKLREQSWGWWGQPLQKRRGHRTVLSSAHRMSRSKFF